MNLDILHALSSKRFTLKALSSVLLASTLGATAAWASTPAYETCNVSNICMWSEADWVGTRLFVGNAPGEKNFTGYSNFNDMASSWANRSISYDARWYYDVDQAGDNRCMDSNVQLAWMGWQDNEEASSSKIYSTNNKCS